MISMISFPNCPITRYETDYKKNIRFLLFLNQSHSRKLQHLRFKMYVALYSNHTKRII